MYEWPEETQPSDMQLLMFSRLAMYARSDEGGGIPSDMQLFSIFSQQVSQVIQVKSAADSYKVNKLMLLLFPLSFGYFRSFSSPNYAIMLWDEWIVDIMKVYIE